MDMAKKASRLVFEPPHELKLEIDALLLLTTSLITLRLGKSWNFQR